ncbi:diacylglycerol/lipid kinase family protein [Nocardioides sp.]|uniref:diacylglycerol/lipid kinase family protein n=1 Tax=Nocardioides sp. TaxID=35761 RepID=UPI003D09EE77
MDPLLVITNSDAGSADQDNLDAALDVLRAQVSVEVAATSNPGELDGVLHRAASRRIVVAGGDGSMHAVVAALHRRNELKDKVLGLIPLGTGNDFARGTGIPLDPAEAAHLVLNGDIRPVDLIVDELGEVVVNNVHAGIGAQASRRAHRWKGRLGKVGLGRLGYPIGAVLSTFQPPFVRLHIEIDGKVVVDLDQPVLQIALGNGSHVGGGTELNPEADPESGRIDVVISRALSPAARLAYVVHLRRGEHHRRDDVINVRAREVSISGEEFWCSADGEIYGPERQRTWRLEPAAYAMTLPS